MEFVSNKSSNCQSRLWQETSVNPASGAQFDNNEHQHQGDSFFGRGSLGQFIERSTSAPPMSTSTTYGTGTSKDNFKRTGNALVGTDLLEYVTADYKDLSINSRAYSKGNKVLVHNSSGDDEVEFGGVWLDLGENNDHDSNDFSAMQSSTVGSINSSISRPLSASGDHMNGLDSRRNQNYTDLPLAIGAGLMRSHSAAPSSTSRSSLGPPPGLVDLADDSYSSSSSSRHHHNQMNQWGNSMRRPIPASALNGGTRLSSPPGASAATLRPAAKTLMDLIQEDASPPTDDVSHLANPDRNHDFRSSGVNAIDGDLSLASYGMSSNSIQSRQLSDGQFSIREHISPSTPTIVGYTPQSTQYQKQQYSVQVQQQADDVGGNDFRNDYQTNLLPQGGLPSQNSVMSHAHAGQHSHVTAQQMVHQTNSSQSNAISQVQISQYEGAGNLEQQYASRNKHQMESSLTRQGFPSEDTTLGSMYNHQIHQQQPPPSQQINHMQQQQQQHIVYNGQRVDLPQGMHTQIQHTLHPQSIQGIPLQNIQPAQTIQLPNGQTVFVNTAAPAPQSYGYATVQYHSPSNQPPHLIQQTMHSGLNDGGQYISVVSIPRGQQMTYWHPNGVTTQQTPLGLSNPNGVTVSLPISGIHRATDMNQQHQVNQVNGNVMRSREKAGGRGRRGATVGRRGADAKAAAVSLTSPLLEEFRASKSRDWTMRRIEGHVVEFCQDQNGSRFIQQRLEMGDVAEQQIVMNEVLPAIRRLRNDVFGNYVVQKLLDFGTSTMKAEIQNTLEGEMVQLSLQMYGCRVVQKALEALNEDDVPRLLKEFHHNVISSIHDQNGNHVIQKCIEVMNIRATKAMQTGDVHRAVFLAEQIDFIIDDVLVNTTSLSCHPYGCRVLQRILEHCSDEKKKSILDEIKKCHEQLLDDQYGNYVIQHVLQFGRDEDRDSILEIVVKNGLLVLSRQKFASNVVEKLLKYGNGPQRCAVVREMLKRADELPTPSEPTDGSNTVVLLMVRDAYANYVVQTTLDVVPESEEKEKLMIELNSHAEELRNYTFAKHIIAKLTSLNGVAQ